MGVDRDDYLMWAVDVGSDAFDWDKHETISETGKPFAIIYDGMSGNYCMAGHIIAASIPYEGFDKVEIHPLSLAIDKHAMAAAVADAFDRPDITPDSFKLILFSHFS